MIDLGDLKHLKDLSGDGLRNELLNIFERVYPNSGQFKYVKFDGRMYMPVESRIGEISPLALETIQNTVNSAYAMFLFGCNLHEYL